MTNPNIFPQHDEQEYQLTYVGFSGRGNFGPGWENNPEYAAELPGGSPSPRTIGKLSIDSMQSFLDGVNQSAVAPDEEKAD